LDQPWQNITDINIKAPYFLGAFAVYVGFILGFAV